MIKIKGLLKKFDDQVVLKGIDLEVEEGELLVLLGESGSGKSVFLQHLIGLLKPDEGCVEIEGVDITGLTEKELLEMRKHIGYLFQEGALYDFMTVYENVAFPLEEHTELENRSVAKKVRRILDIVGLKEAENK